MAIPKIIHQTMADKARLSAAFAQNVAAVRTVNPGWEHRLYDDTDISSFISEAYGREMLALYERLNPAYGAARADLFRYLLVYRMGGVYLDIKSTCVVPLDDVIQPDDRYLLSHWKDRRWGRHAELGEQDEFQQWHVVAEPNHPFLEAVIERVRANVEAYNPARNGVGRMAVFRTTGPIAYTHAIAGIRSRYPHRLVEAEDLGFRYSIFGIDPNQPSHELQFARHYARQRESLVLLPAADVVRKLGRNEVCPCGSGERFKRCHGVM